MFEWLATAWLGVLVVMVLWLPGLAVGYAGGLRGLIAWGAAPLLSSGLIGTAAVVAAAFGVEWSLLVVAAGTVLVSVVAWAVHLLARRWRSPVVVSDVRVRREIGLWVLLALGAAAALQGRRLLGAFGGPDQFPQTYDTPYHLNSVRLILESGDASSLHMTLTAPDVATNFYPGLWHGIVGLAAQVASEDVVLAANWTTVVIGSLVWPASMLVLARAVFGPRPVMLGLTAAMSFTMAQFPNQLTAFGVLYPNLLSYALLPAVLGLGWLVLWRARGRARIAPLFFLGIAALALVFAQPNSIFTLGYLAIPVLVHYVLHVSLRLWHRGGRFAAVAAPVILLVLFVVAYWGAGRIEMVAEFRAAVSWPARMHQPDAINDVLGLAALHPTGQTNGLIAGLVLVGLVASLVVARWRWLPFGYLVLAWLYVVSVSGEESWRELITGYWYGDPQRLAAQIPLLAVPLAVIGLTAVLEGLSSLARSARRERWWRRSTSVPVLAGLAVLLLVALLPRTATIADSFSHIRAVYSTPQPHSGGFVDEDEIAMMEQIEQAVPEDVVVAGNPWSGASMTWAIADRESLFPHTKTDMGEDRRMIATSLGEAGDNPAVCEALDRTNVGYVLTSRSMLWGNDPAFFDGFDVASVRGVSELVAREGDTRLWRITAC